jgi:lactoylglutathione lyase
MPATTKARKPAKSAKSAASNGKATPAARHGAKAPARLALDKLGYAIVYVKDMQRGIRFYRDTLGIPVRMEDAGWTEFAMQGFTLALHPAEKLPKGLDRAAITELCFDAPDVRGVRAELKARGVKVSDLHPVCEMNGKVGAFATFRDPDENHLGIFGWVPKSEWKGPTSEKG